MILIRFINRCLLLGVLLVTMVNTMDQQEIHTRILWNIIDDASPTTQPIIHFLNNKADAFEHPPRAFGREQYSAAELAAIKRLDYWAIIVGYHSLNKDLARLFNCSLYNAEATSCLLLIHTKFFDTLRLDERNETTEFFYRTLSLHRACRLENQIAVRFLIEHNFPINHMDADGLTPLYDILGNKNVNTQMVNYLLDHGAVVNYNKNLGGTPLLRGLVKHVSSDVIKTLIYKGKADVNLADSIDSRSNPIMIAAYNSYDPKIVFLLLEKGANVNYQSMHGYTPLMELCFRHQEDLQYNSVENIFKLLLLFKANPHIKCIHNKRAIDYLEDKNNYLKKLISMEIDPLDSVEHPEKYLDLTCDGFNPVKKYPDDFKEIIKLVKEWRQELANK